MSPAGSLTDQDIATRLERRLGRVHARQRLGLERDHSSGGEGKVIVYQQQDADHYSQIAEIETVKGARTSPFVPQLSRLFVAVRQEGGNRAAIRVYEATD